MLEMLKPVLEAVHHQEPEAFPFYEPVDPNALGIPVSHSTALKVLQLLQLLQLHVFSIGALPLLGLFRDCQESDGSEDHQEPTGGRRVQQPLGGNSC